MRQIRLQIFILTACLAMSVHLFAFDLLSISNLRCEMLNNPLGIDVSAPRFSWRFGVEERNAKQLAYQVIVATSPELLQKNEGNIWNSGKVNSDKSHLVKYGGQPLVSRRTYYWKVRIWVNNGEEGWSQPAHFSMGLLRASDWKAKWIGMDKAFPWDSVSMFARLSARYFRKEVSAPKQVKKATIYMSGLGLYELYINGSKIGDQVLAPGPTDYSKTILYNTFDVTDKIVKGKNVIGTVLGNGRFFAMRQNYKPHKWHTFGFPKLLLQLEVEYTDGTSATIVSDNSWKLTADGPIRTNNEYDGEEYDATKELGKWNEAGYDDRNWLPVQLVKPPGGILKAQMNGNMKVMDRIAPASIKKLAGGGYVLDMGQNMAGWIKMKLRGERGRAVKLRFAESVHPTGELYMANLRDAKVTDIYTLKGEGEESWSPSFVYHGFRYVEISNYPGEPTVNDFVGEVVYDDMKTIGALETSNATMNQIHKNAYWGILSNYKGMPVDCPQRNERQPWLGDRTMGAYGESFIFNNHTLYAKWLDDIRDSQTPEGSIPDVAPSFWFYYKDNMTWPGAYLTIADMIYRQYGDMQPIVRHYPTMKKWLMYMKGKYLTKEYIMTKDSYGDWCVPPESPELIHAKDSARITDPKLIATAYYYYLLQRMFTFAKLAGKGEDAVMFLAEASKVHEAFNKKFFDPTTARYGNNTVTANLLPLAFDMIPAEATAKVFQNICDKILVQNNGHISTGVIGTQWLMRMLTRFGRADIAHKLAGNTTYPSWGYMAANGATTIWELWNGNTANPAMNSQNHVMLLGDLLVWMYENIGGIQSDPSGPGFKKIVMKPSFEVGLSSAKVSYESPYGLIESSWKKQDGQLQWEVNIPANTTAELYVPAGSVQSLKASVNKLDGTEGVKLLRTEKGYVVLELGSGRYSFLSNGLPI